jgi:hypothetical protein
MEEWRYSFTIPDLGMVSYHALAVLPPVKEPLVTIG